MEKRFIKINDYRYININKIISYLINKNEEINIEINKNEFDKVHKKYTKNVLSILSELTL